MTEEPERPYDAGDPTDVRKARREAKRSALSGEQAVRNMLATEAARCILWDYLSACGIYSATFFSDPLAMAWAGGQRSAGLQLLSLIPDDLRLVMASEAKAREEEKNG